MSCNEAMATNHASAENLERSSNLFRQLANRKYYRKNSKVLREKSRLRAQDTKLRRLAEETPEETADRKERHWIAAAKYRQKNGLTLKLKEQKRRPGYLRWLQDHRNRAEEGEEFSRWIVVSEEGLGLGENALY